MPKKFNITGVCNPEQNYMINISSKVDRIIKDYIEQGKYFIINCARQYGKTTTLSLLEQNLKKKYIVITISFEASDDSFLSQYILTLELVERIGLILEEQNINPDLLAKWNAPVSKQSPFDDLGDRITNLCSEAGKDIILMIDDADNNAGNQIFLSFLELLRDKYLEQQKGKDHTFKSVILTGIYDITNWKLNIHPEEKANYSNPCNIVEDFVMDMGFSAEDISEMIQGYEADAQIGIDTNGIGQSIYDYTSGHPYLVSRICQLTDERLMGTEGFYEPEEVWSPKGIKAAELLLREEPDPLFEDIAKKLEDNPELKQIIHDILFCKNSYPFEQDNHSIRLGTSLGLLKENNGTVVIANRIFETKLKELFLNTETPEN